MYNAYNRGLTLQEKARIIELESIAQVRELTRREAAEYQDLASRQ